MSDQVSGFVSTNSAELYAACRSANSLIQVAAYETLWEYLYRVALQVTRNQPGNEALAQDCAQDALIRVHQRLQECREPSAFHAWARRIVTNLAIDVLRRARRELVLDEGWMNRLPVDVPSEFESNMLGDELLPLISQAPISDRSRRVVLGRYLDGIPDEQLAQEESRRAKKSVLPSHVQVTRSKNLSKLRHWEPLRTFWD